MASGPTRFSVALVVMGATRPVLEHPGILENVLARNMSKRLGQTDDIAWCAAFFGRDESRWATAAGFSIDRGATRG